MTPHNGGPTRRVHGTKRSVPWPTRTRTWTSGGGGQGKRRPEKGRRRSERDGLRRRAAGAADESGVMGESCPSCGHALSERSWLGSNWCRALFLLDYLARSPNLTSWELSQR